MVSRHHDALVQGRRMLAPVLQIEIFTAAAVEQNIGNCIGFAKSKKYMKIIEKYKIYINLKIFICSSKFQHTLPHGRKFQ